MSSESRTSTSSIEPAKKTRALEKVESIAAAISPKAITRQVKHVFVFRNKYFTVLLTRIFHMHINMISNFSLFLYQVGRHLLTSLVAKDYFQRSP